MTHAILMTVYKDTELINSIINLYPPNFFVYIHIDKKSIIMEDDIIQKGNVHVFKEYKVNWGGVNHVKALLFLLRHAIKQECDYYHWVTGQDMPIRPETFDIRIKKGVSYLEFYKLSSANRALRYYQRYGLYDIFDAKKRFQQSIIQKINKIQDYFHFSRPFRNYEVLYAGSGYFSLYKEEAKVLLSEYSKWEKYYKYTFCCEESIVQTILLNSARKNNIINDNRRYIEWREPWNANTPPRILNNDDYEKVMNSNCLFCRKIDSEISNALIEKLVQKK